MIGKCLGTVYGNIAYSDDKVNELYMHYDIYEQRSNSSSKKDSILEDYFIKDISEKILNTSKTVGTLVGILVTNESIPKLIGLENKEIIRLEDLHKGVVVYPTAKLLDEMNVRKLEKLHKK